MANKEEFQSEIQNGYTFDLSQEPPELEKPKRSKY